MMKHKSNCTLILFRTRYVLLQILLMKSLRFYVLSCRRGPERRNCIGLWKERIINKLLKLVFCAHKALDIIIICVFKLISIDDHLIFIKFEFLRINYIESYINHPNANHLIWCRHTWINNIQNICFNKAKKKN
jgi:hypothetical protein